MKFLKSKKQKTLNDAHEEIMGHANLFLGGGLLNESDGVDRQFVAMGVTAAEDNIDDSYFMAIESEEDAEALLQVAVATMTATSGVDTTLATLQTIANLLEEQASDVCSCPSCSAGQSSRTLN